MEVTSGGSVSSAERRRSSPTKAKGQGSAAATVTASPTSSRTSDLHRSQSHEPRHTPPLFLMPSTADRSAPAPVSETLEATDRPSGSSARLLDSSKATTKQENTDDKETDGVDNRSTSSAGRDTVVQLNDGGTTKVVVDGGQSISGGDGDKPAPGKTSPVDGCEVGITSSEEGDGDGSWMFGRCRSPIDVMAGCHAAWLGGIEVAQEFVHGLLTTHLRLIKRVLLAVVLVGFAAYLVAAVWKSGLCAIAVIVLAALGVLIQSVRLLKRFCGQRIDTYIIAPVRQVRQSKPCLYLKWSIYLGIIVGLIVFVITDICVDTKRLTSFAGMMLLLLLGFLTSNNPSKVRWRPVLWGLGLQFVLGVLILRWEPGYYFFQYLGDKVRVFLEFADEGSKFVFGEQGLIDHPMAFKIFPIIIYFSAVINIFYYWGLMQMVVSGIAWLMQFTMETTAIESLNAACNIFVGMAESCIIMRPFVYKLTRSELHAVMTGGFATVAGSYIAVLIEVGASPEHLLSAAIMSAPAALAMAKLSYPETEESHTKTQEDVYIENVPAQNLVEAASNGAISAIKVVSSVAANLIAILGLIGFLNALLAYVGGCVGVPELSFQMLCSVLFWPLATIMGVEIEDAYRVASLIGTKVFADEFISFKDLVEMVCKRQIKDRSMVIATYACCGFGSIAAVGVYMGAMISVAPDRRGDISQVALRACVNGNLAGFLTACIAGILYTGASLHHGEAIAAAAKCANVTST